MLRSKLNKLVRSSHNFGHILSFARRGWEAPAEGRHESSHAAHEWILPPPVSRPSRNPEAHRLAATTRNPWLETAHHTDADFHAQSHSRQSVESVDAADTVAAASNMRDSRDLPRHVARGDRSRSGRHSAKKQPPRQRTSAGVPLSARGRTANTITPAQESPKNTLSRPKTKTGMSDRTTVSQRTAFRQLQRMQKKRDDQTIRQPDVRVPVNYNLLRTQR